MTGVENLRQKANEYCQREIEEELLKELNKILDQQKSEVAILIKGLEAFCAILRNKDECKNVDVQLYLEDYEKLRFKLEYIDAKTLTAKNVRKHRERLVEN